MFSFPLKSANTVMKDYIIWMDFSKKISVYSVYQTFVENIFISLVLSHKHKVSIRDFDKLNLSEGLFFATKPEP